MMKDSVYYENITVISQFLMCHFSSSNILFYILLCNAGIRTLKIVFLIYQLAHCYALAIESNKGNKTEERETVLFLTICCLFLLCHPIKLHSGNNISLQKQQLTLVFTFSNTMLIVPPQANPYQWSIPVSLQA